jgi:hypothetical protein
MSSGESTSGSEKAAAEREVVYRPQTRLERMATQKAIMLEACQEADYYVIKGLPIRPHEKIRIVMKGRMREEIECEFLCYNYFYATLLVRCGSELRVIKFSEVKQLIRDDQWT